MKEIPDAVHYFDDSLGEVFRQSVVFTVTLFRLLQYFCKG